MLVLDRKIQEGFWIEGRIFIKVLGIGRRRVKLGIEAPGEMKIVREELWSPSSGETPEEGDLPVSDGRTAVEGSFRPTRRRN